MKTNPKKYKDDRRRRKVYSEFELKPVKYVEFKTKSIAGVSYTHFKKQYPLPKIGDNHNARRKEAYINKKISQGKEYYIIGKNGNRIYIKVKKNEKK